MNIALPDDLQRLFDSLPEGSPERTVAEVLINALGQGRITDSEFTQVMGAFTQMQAKIIRATDKAATYMDKYVKASEQLMAARDCAGHAIAWLNDPLVKPVFILSAWIEAGLNWLFHQPEARP